MPKNIFQDMRDQMKPDDETLQGLHARLETQKTADSLETQKAANKLEVQKTADQAKKTKPTLLWLRFAAPLAACLIVAAFALFSVFMNAPDTPDTPNGSPQEGSLSLTMTNPSSYTELGHIIASYYTTQRSDDLVTESDALQEDRSSTQNSQDSAIQPDSIQNAAPKESGPLSAQDAEDSSGSSGSSDYSRTNIQVSDIDEADVVKTDGRNIYTLSGPDIIIFSAQGAASEQLSRLRLPDTLDTKISDTYSAASRHGSPHDLFIYKDVLVVLSNPLIIPSIPETSIPESSPSPLTEQRYRQVTSATLYDVSDPHNPMMLTQISQSGSYRSARLQQGILYLVSSHSVGNPTDLNHPISYVPFTITDQTSRLMSLEDIHVFPELQAADYTTVSAINLNTPAIISQKTILGGGDTLYMSYDTLYLAASKSLTEESEPYQDSIYTAVDITTKTKTHLIKLSLNQGLLSLTAEAVLNGSPLNQFSMDEYQGNLRIALTTSTSSRRKLVDQSHDIISYQSLATPAQSNAVYVLSPNLTVLGRVEGLAKEERIYSVRFSGDVGYVVTFRQVDPLFTLDLSDPAHPTVQGELKIPGFSTYLHPYAPGRLFGLGYDSDGIRRGSVKLSMFDVSDPYNVTELHTLTLDSSYAEATDNHRAILVDAARNLIGFCTRNTSSSYTSPSYAIYGYSDEAGFYQRADLKSGSGTYSDQKTRGFYVRDSFYVSSNSCLDVFSLSSFERIATLMYTQ
ncbi:MAG: beta-propeller domain-containing protein [Peptococcaceae bacterium]|nr:beta-propeller domain-containing protein [Peptococcaceae bacterium]